MMKSPSSDFQSIDDQIRLTARALYDNESEWPNELHFKKGDILQVLNGSGIAHGWCVCIDRYGNHGIAPANRLKILEPCRDESTRSLDRLADSSDLDSAESDLSNCSSYGFAKQLRVDLDRNGPFFSECVYDVPARIRHGQRPNVRNVPIRIEGRSNPSAEDAVQKASEETVVRDSTGSGRTASDEHSDTSPTRLNSYDSPLTVQQQSFYLGSKYGSLGAWARPTVVESVRLQGGLGVRRIGHGDPSDRQATVYRSAERLTTGPTAVRRPSIDAVQQDLYDVPSSESRTFLLGDLNSGDHVRSATTAAYAEPARKLLPQIFVSDGSKRCTDVLVLYGQLKSTVDELVNDHLPSATKSPTEASMHLLNAKCGETLALLQQLVNVLRDSVIALNNQSSSSNGTEKRKRDPVTFRSGLFPALESSVKLMEKIYNSDKGEPRGSDWLSKRCSTLSQLVGIGRHVLEQLHFMLSLDAKPECNNNNSRQCACADGSGGDGGGGSASRSLFDDYDFVENVVPARVKCESNSERRSEDTLDVDLSELYKNLDSDNLEILKFYSPQINAHIQCLSNFVDNFLTTIENNQPPRVFIGHIKFVVLTAHKLVYIGDSVALCVRSCQLSWAARQRSNRLCQDLRECVASTKQAAQNYPAVADIKSMIRNVMAVSKSAQQLRLLVDGCLGCTN